MHNWYNLNNILKLVMLNTMSAVPEPPVPTLTQLFAKSFGDRTYSYHAPRQWNALPASI